MMLCVRVCLCVRAFAPQVQTWAQQQAGRIQTVLSALQAEREEVQRLLDWISSAEESLNLKEQEALPEDLEQTAEVITQHNVLMLNNINQNLPAVFSLNDFSY